MSSTLLTQRAAGNGSTRSQYKANASLYGKNLMAVPVPTFIDLLVTECLHPFFIFQCYSVILWICENYFIFAIVIGVMAVASVGMNIYDTIQSITRLQSLARSDIPMTVIRDGQRSTVSSTTLALGDLVVLHDQLDVPCDMSMLTGSAVINEAMLTGESVPVVKYPILDSATNTHVDVEVGKDTRSTLFAGTRVMQLKPSSGSTDVLAVVVRTGFSTTKGNMISSMLYPPESTFTFQQQTYKYMAFLFGLSCIGFGITIWRYRLMGADAGTMMLRALDLVTIVIPPSLPLAMSIGVNFSIVSLQKLKIYCIDPERITFAGKIKLMCFDKTGTLTADSLQFRGVHSFVPLNYGGPISPIIDTKAVSPASQNSKISTFTFDKHILPVDVRACLATCHSLATHKGSFVGDPLEIEGFASSHANFEESNVRGVLFHTQLRTYAVHRVPLALDNTSAVQSNEDTSILNLESVMSDDDEEEDEIVVSRASRAPRGSSVVHGDLIPGWEYQPDITDNCQCDCHFYPAYSQDTITCQCGCSAESPVAMASDSNDVQLKPISSIPKSNYKHVPLPVGGSVPVSIDCNIKGTQGRTWATVKQFPFESSLQRMSVLAINETDLSLHAFVKGAPEMIASFCRPETVPDSYQHTVDWYTHEGHRVIALATKHMSLNDIATGAEGTLDIVTPDCTLESRCRDLATAGADREYTDIRTQVESNLTLLGLLVLENALKPVTKSTIARLQNAAIRTVMVTGDNVRTAVSVSKECGIIAPHCAVFVSTIVKPEHGPATVDDITWRHSDRPEITLNPLTFQLNLPSSTPVASIDFDKYELAVTGDAFALLVADHEAQISAHAALLAPLQSSSMQTPLTKARTTGMSDPNATSVAAAVFEFPGMRDIRLTTLLQKVVLSGAVFARFTPDQKACVVSTLMHLGMFTGMCGDGANDCGALKTSHVGISLAESEASIAAPFTSQIPDISCVPLVLLQGRSALTTSFQLFRFMSIYSFVQFFAVILLYFRGGNFCDYQFLYQDLFAVFPFAIFMGKTPASKKLTSKRPSANLLSAVNLISILTHMTVAGLFQWTVFYMTQYQDGYTTYPNESMYCEMWEATAGHYFVCMQYVLYCILCSISPPWKKRIYRNIGLVIVLIGSFSMTITFFLTSPSSNKHFFFTCQDQWIPVDWRVKVMLIFCGQIMAAIFIEYGFVKCMRWLIKRSKTSTRTNTIYGKGNNQLEKGGKPYHLIRRDFEDNWPQNAVPIIIDTSYSKIQT